MRKINAEERIRQLIDDVKPTAETLDIWSLATADGYMDCHKKAEKLAEGVDELAEYNEGCICWKKAREIRATWDKES